MKKILLLFLAVLGANTIFAQDIAIADKAQFLQFIIDSQTNNYADKTVKLTGDIDLEGTEIDPIKAMAGTFDGQGHVISNFIIKTQTENTGTGLFRTVSGTITNLNIDNASITMHVQAVGILVGMLNGKIKKCSVINSSAIDNKGKVGILAGRTGNGSIENCLVINCTVSANEEKAGILVGEVTGASNSHYIKNCIVLNSAINGTTLLKGYVCGGFGWTYVKMAISNCYVNTEGALAPIPSGGAGFNVTIDAATVMKKDDIFFTSGESSYTLNKVAGNTGAWSHDGTNPIFADATNLPVAAKAGQTDGTIQAYAAGTKVIAKDFNYIKFDAANSEIVDYANLSFFTAAPSNGLIYLPNGANLPTAIPNNVVAGTICASLALTDGKSFVCPTAFTATKAAYTRDCHTDGGWESIALPFAVAAIKADGNDVFADYTIEGYAQNNGATIKFTPLETITGWEAGKAYIMKYNGEAGSSQTCVFESNNAAINADATDAPFMGTFTGIAAGEATDNYILVADGTQFKKASASASIPAFRAYLKKATDPVNAPASYSVEHGGGATAIDNAQQNINAIYAADGAIIINTDKTQTIHIYGVDGRRVRTIQAAEGETTINGLAQGIYIVNNQKLIIK